MTFCQPCGQENICIALWNCEKINISAAKLFFQILCQMYSKIYTHYEHVRDTVICDTI